MSRPQLSETQVEGFDFLVEALAKYRYAYLADVPGMGKTILGLRVALHHVPAGGRILYVTPAAVKPQIQRVWESEGRGSDVSLHLLAYPDLQKMALVKQYRKERFDFGILDEAHYIKTAITGGARYEAFDWPDVDRLDTRQQNGSKTSFVARTLGATMLSRNCERVLHMSGTPVTRDPRDLFPFLWEAKHPVVRRGMRDASGSFYSFCDRYMYRKTNSFGVSFSGLRKDTADELREAISDILLRREHSDEKSEELRVAEPDVFETRIPVPEDLQIADTYVLNRLSESVGVDLTKDSSALRDLIGVVPGFATLSRFREAQSHAKITPALNYVAFTLKSRKFILFCYHKSAVPEYVSGLRAAMPGVPVVGITGAVSVTRRARMVREANEAPEAIIVATMGSIGTGFDCNKFQTVLIAELDWSPVTVEQSIGRVQRKGSGLKPQIHFLLFETGVENYIRKTLRDKTSNIKKMVNRNGK